MTKIDKDGFASDGVAGEKYEPFSWFWRKLDPSERVMLVSHYDALRFGKRVSAGPNLWIKDASVRLTHVSVGDIRFLRNGFIEVMVKYLATASHPRSEFALHYLYRLVDL